MGVAFNKCVKFETTIKQFEKMSQLHSFSRGIVSAYPETEIMLACSPPAYFQGEALPRIASPFGMYVMGQNYVQVIFYNVGQMFSARSHTL